MKIDRANLEKYMSDFVDLQLKVQSKTAETLPKLKDKLANKIRNLKVLDATERYELLTRLESMPRHTKLCHGDFNPSNVIVEKNGKMTVIDWAHASGKCKRRCGNDIFAVCITRSGECRSLS